MTTLKEKIEAVRRYAPTQPDIVLCARILAVCDAAQRMDAMVNGDKTYFTDEPITQDDINGTGRNGGLGTRT